MSTKIPGEIIFISSGYQIQEVVISSHCLKAFRYPGIGKKNIPCFAGLGCKTIRKN